MILILTSISFSSARFEGSLNMDLNEIAMNLVPFPQLHYLVSSLTPLYVLADVNVPTRRYLLKKYCATNFLKFRLMLNSWCTSFRNYKHLFFDGKASFIGIDLTTNKYIGF